MKTASASLVVLLLLAPACFAQQQEEIESYLVAPYTRNKMVSATMLDGKAAEGKVLRGDDEKIVVQQKNGSVELPISQVATIRFRRAKSSAKLDFVGNLLGGLAFGFGGAEIGKRAGESIRDDGTTGKAGPIVGGVALGFAGGYIGRQIMRHAVTEEVTLKILHSGEAP